MVRPVKTLRAYQQGIDLSFLTLGVLGNLLALIAVLFERSISATIAARAEKRMATALDNDKSLSVEDRERKSSEQRIEIRKRQQRYGSQVSFLTDSRATVDALWADALRAGATDEGAPGLRPQYASDFYAAYCRDPEGRKLCFVYTSGDTR